MRDTGKPEAYQTILVGVDSQLPGRLGSSSGSYPAKPTDDPTPSIRDVTNLPRVDHRHQAGGVNRHWVLTVVPLSAYSILVELVTRLKVLLAANNLDSMSMNTAIQAVSLYVQIKSASDLDAETLASYDRKSPPKALSNRAFTSAVKCSGSVAQRRKEGRDSRKRVIDPKSIVAESRDLKNVSAGAVEGEKTITARLADVVPEKHIKSWE